MVSLDHLRTLNAFVRLGSMMAAAKDLGLTQPAVSMQLKALEEVSPEKIFFQDGTKKLLTPFGKRLFEIANDPLESLENKISQLMTKPHQNEYSLIRLAGREDIAEDILSIRENMELPSSLEFFPCSSEDAAKKVLDREVEFAISYHVPQSFSLISKKILTSVPQIIYSSDKSQQISKVSSSNFSASEIIKFPWLVYRRSDPALLNLCKLHNIPITRLNIKMVAPNWKILVSAALRGEGFAIVPSNFILETHSLNRIKVFGETKNNSFEYHLIYPKEISKQKNTQAWVRFFLGH